MSCLAGTALADSMSVTPIGSMLTCKEHVLVASDNHLKYDSQEISIASIPSKVGRHKEGQ